MGRLSRRFATAATLLLAGGECIVAGLMSYGELSPLAPNLGTTVFILLLILGIILWLTALNFVSETVSYTKFA